MKRLFKRKAKPSKPPEHQRLRGLLERRALTASQQAKKATAIYDLVLRNSSRITQGNFDAIGGEDLGLLFQATDEEFFDGLVGSLCESVAARPLSFRLSTRMTSTGGMTTMQKVSRARNAPSEFEIAIGTTPLFESFRDADSQNVVGLVCHDRLQALQRIMEHEMVHLIELLLTEDSSCAAKPFKRIVRNFFGHTESKHRLLTPTDVARTKLGLSPGDRVRFTSQGQEHVGHLHRITKRATVLVPDAQGIRYTDGHRYHKFYVPLAKLKRAS